MKSILQLIMALFIFPFLTMAQDRTEVSVKRERVFTGAGLYGFMNGGAELFLEYGVQRLTTRDLVYKGEEFNLDIYEMPSAEDAYGIYSLHVFKCLRTDSAECVDCLSMYQLQMAVGKCYVSLVFPSGSDKAKSLADELIRLYVDTRQSKMPVFPKIAGAISPYSGLLKFARGPISASAALPALRELTENISYSGIWCYVDKKNRINNVWIDVKDKKELEKLKERVDKDHILSIGELSICFKCPEKKEEAPSESPFGF